jgi:two-component system nitrogen regulation sensor histidine kinase NtrY
MTVTVRQARPRPRPLPPVAAGRPPFRDNPRLIIAGILLLLGALAAMIFLANRSPHLDPDFLAEVVLYAVSAVDVTMLLALGFMLARNIVKMIVERRRALPFARFRAKLVVALLGMTIVPSVLVLITGTELILNSAARWFSAPVDDVLSSATAVAGAYYQDREKAVRDSAGRVSRSIDAAAVDAGNVDGVRAAIEPEIRQARAGMVEVYRLVPSAGPRPEVVYLVSAESPALPRGHNRAAADRLASKVALAGVTDVQYEPLDRGGELVRGAALVRRAGQPVGVVVVSEHLSGDLAMHSRRIRDAYEKYKSAEVLKRPLEGVYLSFFLMVTLFILLSATWMGGYIAKRITRPVQLLAEGAREIGAGHLDHRIEQETADEFGALVEAFNSMVSELASSQRKLERSRLHLERKNQELDERRRYIETILERIATGVISIAPDGRITTLNPAAARLLGLDAGVAGRPAAPVLERPDLQPLGALLRSAVPGAEPIAQEISTARDGREVHLAAAATALQGEAGSFEGTVLVFDDVTPLIRAQKVAAWRDVARRLAHEIKNPLTPIQLSADRLRRHFSTAPAGARSLVEECTGTIVTEVESLKSLVDEFAQFARMPAPRTVPSDLHALLGEALALYNGLFRNIRIERRLAEGLPPVRIDAEQIRRVIINLVDNAVEALGGTQAGPRPDGTPAGIVIETQYDATNGVARIIIADNGPGIPAADREKLFMPYYSTKRRGSGLGLAIVRRIIAEHGGSIEVGDNAPTGTRFTIELPC